MSAVLLTNAADIQQSSNQLLWQNNILQERVVKKSKCTPFFVFVQSFSIKYFLWFLKFSLKVCFFNVSLDFDFFRN